VDEDKYEDLEHFTNEICEGYSWRNGSTWYWSVFHKGDRTCPKAVGQRTDGEGAKSREEAESTAICSYFVAVLVANAED